MSTRHHIAAALLALGLGSLSLGAHATHYPLKVDNCGYTLEFAKAPGSVITVGQAGTEMLYALGLGNKVAGTSLWFNPVLPKFKDINAKVPRLADNDPSFRRWWRSARGWWCLSSSGRSARKAWWPRASSFMI